MGKGKRNRDRKRLEAATPKPEMLPNTADSLNDMPDPGRLSEHTRDELQPDVKAWGLMQSYTAGLLLELDRGHDAPEPDAGDQGRDVADLLEQVQPHMVAGCQQDAAEFVAGMKPRWRGRVAKAIFTEVAGWLEESGYTPDQREWFTGARLCGRVMVPEHHRDELERLLDYDVLLAHAAEINARFPDHDQVPAFDYRDPEQCAWFDYAMTQVHPVVMVHAAAALACWLQTQPDAVVDVLTKRIDLGERAVKYEQILASAPPRKPREPEAAERPWTPPWEVHEQVPSWRTDPTGDPVPIRYDGPPLSIWQAAWLYAEAICDLDDQQASAGQGPTGEAERVLLARAITCAADQAGLPAMGADMLDRPDALAAVSMLRLYQDSLHEVRSILEFGETTLGRVPRPGEPGYATYQQLAELVRQDDVTPAELLADPELKRRIDEAIETWGAHRERAQNAVMGAIMRSAANPHADVPLFLFGGWVNDYLRRTHTTS